MNERITVTAKKVILYTLPWGKDYAYASVYGLTESEAQTIEGGMVKVFDITPSIEPLDVYHPLAVNLNANGVKVLPLSEMEGAESIRPIKAVMGYCVDGCSSTLQIVHSDVELDVTGGEAPLLQCEFITEITAEHLREAGLAEAFSAANLSVANLTEGPIVPQGLPKLNKLNIAMLVAGGIK